jgi:hypothetical protein
MQLACYACDSVQEAANMQQTILLITHPPPPMTGASQKAKSLAPSVQLQSVRLIHHTTSSLGVGHHALDLILRVLGVSLQHQEKHSNTVRPRMYWDKPNHILNSR